MFTKVIVGRDGLAGGDDALALARALAPGAELVLATAYAYDPRPGRGALLGYGNALRDVAEQALRSVRAAAALPAARIVALPDTSPSRALHRLAADEHADLLVVGSAHHGTVGRLLLGDVARATLHGAPCPVAVAPRGCSGGPIATIGVACNDAPEARLAATVAADLGAALGARVLLRDVVESNLWATFGGHPVAIDLDELLDDARERARRALQETCATLPGEVEAAVVVGSTAGELDALAAEVDLLVCGSRGWGAVRRVVLGSTTDRLIHHAPCPVLVVPRSAAAAMPGAPLAATARA
jgi:nucleotide-binding universal stress UspA family protein